MLFSFIQCNKNLNFIKLWAKSGKDKNNVNITLQLIMHLLL